MLIVGIIVLVFALAVQVILGVVLILSVVLIVSVVLTMRITLGNIVIWARENDLIDSRFGIDNLS